MIEDKKSVSGQDISALCKRLLPDRDNTTLLKKLTALYGHDQVSFAYQSKDWFQVGGIVDQTGQTVAKDLFEWVERTYLECGRDLQVLIDHILEQQLIATKVAGNTLYFSVNTGDNAEDAILIEIEKSQEKTDRLLVSPEDLPECKEDISDPFLPSYVDGFNIGPASYAYKGKTDIAVFMQSLSENHPDKHPIQRFIDDWNQSSAAKFNFSEDWLIRPLKHVGRYGENVLNAELIPLRQSAMSNIETIIGKHGSDLHTVLKRFDKKAGYPFAWYFYMVTEQLTSKSAEAVYEDISGDFAYLPASDEAILRAWMQDPYYIN